VEPHIGFEGALCAYMTYDFYSWIWTKKKHVHSFITTYYPCSFVF